MRRIYVQAGPVRHIALTEEGRLTEYLLDDVSAVSAEAIYLGRVERVVSGMQAAFVDIGQEKNGFLPLEEHSKTAVLPKLQAGMQVLVQVKKDAQGTKGAFLSRDITLCGRYALVMPVNRHVGVSARIEDEEDRRALRALGEAVAEGRFGLVLRQAALEAGEAELREEVAQLLAQWQTIQQSAPTAHAPSLIHRPRTLLDSLLDDMLPRGVDELVTDDPTLTAPGIPVVRWQGEGRMMDALGLTAQREKALQRRVWLPCGANLIIDPCEAMTVIDVNTAKFTGRRDAEQTLLKADLEAADEIARQVRLRNLGGIILIDMIDLQEPEHREQVLEALRAALAQDRVKTVVHGLTSLGLVEMTRKKSRVSLREEWTCACAACRGTGRVSKEENHG